MRVGEAHIWGWREEGEVEEEKGETEHRYEGWREDGEVKEEGETEQRRSRFILFKRTLVGASSATGAAAAVTTTATAKATTRGDLIAGLL